MGTDADSMPEGLTLGSGLFLGDGHVKADGDAVAPRPDLDQIAKLVREPQTSSASLVERRGFPSNKRILDVAAVPELTEKHARLFPDSKDAVAAPMPNAVAGGFIHGQDELLGSL